MKAELAKLIKAERKHKRELAELRAMRQKVAQQKPPDPKVLAMIDEQIAELTK